ncbi:MAG: CdaR family protein [Thermodesulfovibrionales bacterium]|jgi:YbbR domain-containing protein
MIRRLLLDNLSLKAAALMLAILLWLFVSSKGQMETSLDVPIEYINIPRGIEISKHVVNSANVVIRGHESILKNIRQGEVRVSVDMSKAKEGEGTFPIKKDDVQLPYAATVIKVDPSFVKVTFEKTISKTVGIRPVITGNPQSGYSVKAMEVKPKDAVIEGAESEVNKVSYLKTEPVDITGVAEDVRQEVELAQSGRNIRTAIHKVEVIIKITRRER